MAIEHNVCQRNVIAIFFNPSFSESCACINDRSHLPCLAQFHSKQTTIVQMPGIPGFVQATVPS